MSGNSLQDAIDRASRKGRYDFARDNSIPQRFRCLGVHQARANRNSYEISRPENFSIERFAQPENLHSAFRILRRSGGQAAGRDGLSYRDYSPGEIYGALRVVSRAILDKTYRPYPTRLIRIPKGNGRFRELRLQIILDRVVAKSLQRATVNFWQKRLPNIGCSPWHIFRDMFHIIRDQRRYFLVTDDVRNAFPSARITDVMDCHQQYINEPNLLWLIENVIRGHDGPEHTIGLDQGSPYSPLAMELLLHNCLDARLGVGTQGLPPMLRYVDNLTWLSRSAEEGNLVILATQAALDEAGLQIKGEDGPATDLRDPSTKHEVLGLIPKWEKGKLTFKIPNRAWQRLQEALQQSMASGNPTVMAEVIVTGWIQALGPALTETAIPQLVRKVISLAARHGIRELKEHTASVTAHKGWDRWNRFVSTVPTGREKRQQALPPPYRAHYLIEALCSAAHTPTGSIRQQAPF